MNDIRKHINLIESVQSVVEDDLSKYEDIVLNWFMNHAKEDELNIEDVYTMGWLGEFWYHWVAEKKVMPEKAANTMKKYSVSKWEKLFKQKFGVSDEDVVKQALDAAHSSFTETDQAIIKGIAEQFITLPQGVASDIKKGELRYYVRSPKSVSVLHPENFNYPEAIFGPAEFKKLGITPKDFVAWLDKHGVKKTKRPKSSGRSYSYYD